MMTYFNSKALLTIYTNYSCQIKPIEFVQPIIWAHIISPVMDSLGVGTHKHKHIHTNYKCIPTLQTIETRHALAFGRLTPGLTVMEFAESCSGSVYTTSCNLFMKLCTYNNIMYIARSALPHLKVRCSLT